MSASPTIAIVGAGFSGTLLAVQLAARATSPLHIELYDAAGAFARGIAYSTLDPQHLLNVRADRMGAFADKQDDFYRWLLAHESEWREKHPALANLKVIPEGFMPRMLYGDYISWLFEKTQSEAQQVTLEKITAEVTGVAVTPNGITLTLKDGKPRIASRLVLAIGSLAAGTQRFEQGLAETPRYTSSIWSPPEGSVFTQNRFTDKDEPVLIIGTGLTMIDAFLSLRHRGYTGKIIALSRHGLLPQPHATNIAPYSPFLFPATSPRTAFGLMDAIRREVKQAQVKGVNWRGVIDSLRADTPQLWAALPEKERTKLVRLLSFWGTHRHRMPVSSAEAIRKDTDAGRLEILAGRVESITQTQDKLAVQIRNGGKTQMMAAAHVINCAGPVMDISVTANPLLAHLQTRGFIAKGPLAMGISADADGRAKGKGEGRLFALGPLLTGERLETIAVPELRSQAESLAVTLLASLNPAT